MNRAISRIGAAVVAVALSIGGFTGLAISASAAPASPAPLQPSFSFSGTPTAATMNGSSRAFHIDDLGSGTAIHPVLRVAPAATPTVFSTFYDYGAMNADSTGSVTVAVNSIFGSGNFATGDVLKMDIGYNSLSYNYVIPATGAVASKVPVVNISGTPTAAEFFAGRTVSITNIDTAKRLLIETTVERAIGGGNFSSPAVISRQYVEIANLTTGTWSGQITAFSDLDTSLPLNTGDAVTVRAVSGAGVSNTASDTAFLVAAPVVVVPDPSGSFHTSAPSAAGILAGVTYDFIDLDNTKNNVAQIWVAPASAPTTFSKVGADLNISNASIVGGAASISVSAFYIGTPNTALHAGDVIEIRLIVDAGTPAVTTSYVIPAPPVVPGTPAGSFSPVAPTATEFFNGVDYNFAGLDNTVTNVAQVWIAPVSDPTNFAKAGSDITIASADIVGGAYTSSFTLYTDSTPISNLYAGDVVQVKLIVAGGAPSTLTTYTLPPLPGSPAGAFNPVSPTGAQFITGVDFKVVNLDASKSNVLKVYTKESNGAFVLTATLNVLSADIANGDYTATVISYLTADNGATKTALPNGSVVRVTLTVGAGTETTLQDYTIGSGTPGGGANELANTGTADERGLQNTLIIVCSIAGVLGIGVVALILIRRRKSQRA